MLTRDYIQALSKKQLPRDIFTLLVCGFLSAFLGMIQFNIPGMQSGVSDLREIPLLIGIFHLRNPIYTIGLSLFSLLGSPAGAYIPTFFMHQIPLLGAWLFFRWLNSIATTPFLHGTAWFSFTLFYYYGMLVPVMMVTNKMTGLNLENEYIAWYKEVFYTLRFEVITTSLISSLYLIQYEIRKILQTHKQNLEVIIEERTKDIEKANEELTRKNNELLFQSEKLSATLERLKQTQSLLVQSEKMASLGTLTAGIAHEINNPLNFIYGGIQLVHEIEEEGFDRLSPEIRALYQEAFSMISSGLDRTTNIVKALSLFSSRAKPVLKPVNLNQVLDNVLLFLSSKITSGIFIRKEYQLLTEVTVYEGWMHQVLMNIIDNAIFAVKEGNTNDYMEIILHTEQSKDRALIRITNNGQPIPENIISRIFDPFFTTKEPGTGTGLGLSISYSYILEHHGTIQAMNTPTGVSFLIDIPIHPEIQEEMKGA